ncbi:MAG: nucleotidyltransferase domain-containing protein [Acidobacteria bacterium]|nr:nucleotidyltransferase domain-containing protein [Acidobacteriota bacterium]
MERKSVNKLIEDLKERAKELNCLYEVEEIMSNPNLALEDVLQRIVMTLPSGWQFPDICQARIVYGDFEVHTSDFRDSPWAQHADILVQEQVAGRISVCYLEDRPLADEGPFLKEERKLINTIADRLKHRILHTNLKKVFERTQLKGESHEQWAVVLDLLRRTDPKLLTRISRKMLNHLSWAGYDRAHRILESISPTLKSEDDETDQDENRPLRIAAAQDLLSASEDIFKLAGKHLSDAQILTFIQKWMQEDRSGFLIKALENPNSSLAEIAGAIERYSHLIPQGVELASPRERAFRVSLIQRILSEDANFVQVAKQYISINDFHDLLDRTIFPTGSHGKLGGKGAGLFVASQILKKHAAGNELLHGIKTPKTWYLTSDGLHNFINHNDLEEIAEHKYKDIGQIRQEYPAIIQVFKSASFSPEIVNSMSNALDDLPEVPLIVRSSSLLEDTKGTSFAGKYKSLFIANQGSKHDRMMALMDAVAEVYASTFGPDPLVYRMQKGLIDYHEEMAIMIQEVVGARIGRYYLPAFAGVAFSRNEFQWSRRIRREDGLLRMVPGLGTRAVDRVQDDYPILISPGQPSLRVNVTVEEKVRYSPKRIDVINLESGLFETIEIRDLLAQCGNEYPMIHQLVSILQDDRLVQPWSLGIDWERDPCVVTFEGLFGRTQFIEQATAMLKTLQAEFRAPIDIEFAHDGTDLYLVQCRLQSHGAKSQPASIPRDVPKDRILFSANRYVTNGAIPDITHIVYVDPQKYAELPNRAELLAVGRAVAALNQLLPKRRFILMGPGRWGSRGDIRLGVSVSYSDINNTAMLIEIAQKQKDYIPELSFGTHFFQDLVEASIRYLPLYPGDWGTLFNESFFRASRNWLPELLPDFAHLAEAVRVIDVANTVPGMVLQVLMNGELDEALAVLAEPSRQPIEAPPEVPDVAAPEAGANIHWRWRLQSVERIAELMDPNRFGVKALYLFGSTQNATAGPQSDIDLLIHFGGTEAQEKDLMLWLEGWSLCLSYINYLKTGFKTDGLLSVHLITDKDIQNQTSYAVRIGATNDPAFLIPLGKQSKN